MASKLRSLFRSEQKLFGSFYIKSLVLTLFVAGIPGLIIGFSTYWFVGGRIDRELQSQSRQQFEQSVSYFDEQFSHMEVNIAHWSFDPSFGNELRKLDFVRDYIRVRQVFQTIPIMELSDPLIDHVELYLNEPRPVLFTTSNYTFLEGDEQIGKYTAYFARPKSIGWTLSEGASGAGTGTGTGAGAGAGTGFTLYNRLPGGEASSFGVILVMLSERQLIDMLLTLTPHNLGSSFLMTEQGQWLESSSGAQPSELEALIQTKVLAREGDTGSFLFKWGGTSYTVSFGKIERLGSTWTFVSLVPLTAITEPVRVISQVILWISAIGLLLATLLSWLASRQLYSPVKRLVQVIAGEKDGSIRRSQNDEFAVIEAQWQQIAKEHQSLQSRLSEQLPYLKEGYLLQLVQGYLYSFSEDSVRSRMEQYGWEVADKQFVAMMIQLSGFANLQGRFFEGDEGLVTFVAANIVDECKENAIGEAIVVNFHDLSIGLLLLAPKEKSMDELRDGLSEFSDRLIQAIRQVLSLRVTVSVSANSQQAHQIPYLFEEARQALTNRDLLHDKQVLGLEREALAEGSASYQYPFAIEKEIIHALRMGVRDELFELVPRFMKELAAGGAKELIIRHGMLQLLASVQHVMMKMGVSPEWLAGNALNAQLSQLDDPNAMLKWFLRKVIEPCLSEWDKKQDEQLLQLMDQVIQYMQSHYMQDISLESCADRINVYSYTLSKTFKQVTGVNFVEYLTGIRLERAKELLAKTDWRINDIAEKVGYQPTYFNRIFKKLEGLTPSQYREKTKLD
ncbi:helix-turn-helix domain-containing protein [Cohnella fermenti]|uniref:AraC family transcriptional regulator n=1 Tax=Cohnella fermenti TaxID=2565925 RepID=A0A4S4BRU8_9BACL|nr:helix-turn-helix domain-containing protein [Cohnella fermenti]THF77741.1 AraC family transcriptional regulator [Cohnella fermenti]